MLLALVAAACGPGNPGAGGDGGAPDAPPGSGPMLIAGGGVANGPIAGTLYIYVVESGGSKPIGGAQVRVGAASDPSPRTATTDATGLASFTDAGLTGPQTITATVAGHAAATWIGANGTDVTIPLDVSPRTTPVAHATGTIAGWSSLPSPSITHYNLGVVLYSFVSDVGSPDNSIAQGTSTNGTPLDTCLTSVNGSSCAWQLATRTGPQIHLAAIVDGNTNGTPSDPSDDTYTLIGYAAGSPVTMSSGQTLSNESLAMIAKTSETAISVSLPSAPPGLAHVIAIPMLDTGTDGKLVFPLPQIDPGHPSSQVLAPTGQFAGTYDVVALATPNATTSSPYSTVLQNGVTLPSVTIDPFLAAPSGLSATGGTYKFTAAAGASLHDAQLRTSAGTVLWNVSILDGSTSFALPALTPDPLPTGKLTLAITAADIASFDPGHFAVPDLTSRLHRASGSTTTFTH
jgi:hypothetical protein